MVFAGTINTYKPSVCPLYPPLPLAGEGWGEGGYNIAFPLTVSHSDTSRPLYFSLKGCGTVSSPLRGEEDKDYFST